MRPATGVMDGDGVKRMGSPTSDPTDPEITEPGIPRVAEGGTRVWGGSRRGSRRNGSIHTFVGGLQGVYVTLQKLEGLMLPSTSLSAHDYGSSPTRGSIPREFMQSHSKFSFA